MSGWEWKTTRPERLVCIHRSRETMDLGRRSSLIGQRVVVRQWREADDWARSMRYLAKGKWGNRYLAQVGRRGGSGHGKITMLYCMR